MNNAFACPKCGVITNIKFPNTPNLGYWEKLEVQCRNGHKTIYPYRGDGFPPAMRLFLGKPD